MNSILAFPHIDGDVKQANVSLIQSRLEEHPEMETDGWTSTPPPETTIVKKDPLGSPHSTWISLIMTSEKKMKHH